MRTIIERILVLEGSALCRALPTEALLRLALAATEETRDPGPLWREGDAAESIYIVADGAVVVRDHTAGAGHDLGAAALLGADRRATAATVLRSSTLLCITRDDFFDVLAEYPEASRALLQTLGARLDVRPLDLSP